ncbi:MAG: aspartate carbamoyltransferase [Acidobacteria bacterium]|nr:aspartate carbamoyltransferase [Acidobacteriota bacterium]
MRVGAAPAVTALRRKDLLGIAELSTDEIALILDTAEAMKEVGERPIKKVPALRGKTVVNLFFEPSTRTRTSFEIAEKRLSADTLNIAVASSSVVKGETLADTALNLEAMRPDMIVLRHSSSGACHLLSGDLLHSRVLRSNIHLLTKMGSDVWVCGPPTLIPTDITRFGVRATSDVDEAVADADVIMLLRIQLERMEGAFFPSLREYFNVFGMTEARLRRAKPDVMIMHPGPMNRGVEIASEVADGPYSVILEQVANGVAVRMAVLYLLAGGVAHEEAA